MEPVVIEGTVDAAAGLHRVVSAPGARTLSTAGSWLVPDAPGWDHESCTRLVSPRTLDDTEWTVGTHGTDTAFVADSIVGAWDISPGELLYAGGIAELGPVALLYLPALRLEVLSVAGEVAELRLVSQIYGEEGECVVLRDAASLSATGELSWSQDVLSIPTDSDPLVLYAPTFRIGFDSLGAAAGGEVSTIIDLRATSNSDFYVCDLVVQWGGACVACPDGNPSCLGLAGFAWTATRSAEPAGTELPTCGADFSDTGVMPDFDLDCGDSGGTLCAGTWLVFLAPMLRRRRRGAA